MKQSKRYTTAKEKFSKNIYSLSNAIELVKENANAKFDESIDVVFKFNLDTTKSEQQLRGAMVLPHGTGRSQVVLAITSGENLEKAKQAGADFVFDEEVIQKIKNEQWFEYDVIVATPDMMPKIGQIGQILGPKGLMPNPKVGTVTTDITKAVNEIKGGKVTYRTDKSGNVHAIMGKVSFDNQKIIENFQAFHSEMMRLKPSTVKGIYVQNIAISSTMGPAAKIDPNSIN